MYSGIESFYKVPVDRTIFYGAYCYYTSLANTSPFIIIYLQGLALSYLFIRFISINSYFVNNKYTLFFSIIIVTFSYTSVLCSSIMPDIWSSLGLISTIIITSNVSKKIFPIIILAISVLVSPINGFIYFVGVFISAIYSKYKFFSLSGHSFAIITIIISLLITLIPPYLTYKIFNPIPGRCAFLLNSLSTKGVLAKGIDKHCVNSPDSFFCLVDRDTLKKKNEILWNDTGSELKIWDINNHDICSFVYSVIKDNLMLYASESLKSAFIQITMMPNNLKALYNTNYPLSSSTSSCIKKIYPKYFQSFSNSLQQTDSSFFDYFKIYKYFIITLFFISILFTIRTSKNNLFYTRTVYMLLSCYVANLIFTSALQGVDERFNVRIADISLILFIISKVKQAHPA